MDQLPHQTNKILSIQFSDNWLNQRRKGDTKMKRKSILTVLAGFALLVQTCLPAFAMPLVDTGAPPVNVISGSVLSPDQWLAGQFTLNQSAAVGSIQGWMGSDFGTGGDATVKLYTDSAGLPGAELFQSSFTVPANSLTTDWYGATGLNWLLGQGTYWAAFEADGTNTLAVSDGFMPDGAPAPLAAYAYNNGLGYVQSTDLSFGVRIEPVPEPSTFILLGAGLTGIGLLRKRARKI